MKLLSTTNGTTFMQEISPQVMHADRQLLSEFELLKCFRFSLSQEKHTFIVKIDIQDISVLILYI